MTNVTDDVEVEREVNLRMANEVRSWLARRRLTQSWLAETLGVGRSAIVKKMAGEQSFSLTQLVVIADALSITLGQLFGEELLNEKNPHPMGEGSQGRNSDQGVARARFELATSGL